MSVCPSHAAVIVSKVHSDEQKQPLARTAISW